MHKIFIIAALLCYFNSPGQSKLKFKTINQFGVALGASQNATQFNSINGVGYKTFSAGIGVGFDSYYFKTVPVFLDLRKNIFNREHTPFVYADAGYNFPKGIEYVTQWEKSTYSGGVYYDLGIGYQIPLAGKLALNMSVGYSQKNLDETKEYSLWGMPNETRMEYYNYTFRRATIKLALSF